MITQLVQRTPVSKTSALPCLCLLACFLLGACGAEPPRAPIQDPKVTKPDPPAAPEPRPAPRPAKLLVTSNPSGAGAYLGAKTVEGIVRFETGRFVGTTPLTVNLSAADVSRNEGDGFSNLHVQLKKNGYRESIKTIGLGRGGNLVPGRTYEVNLRLTRLP